MVFTINYADQRLGVVSFMTPSAPSEKSMLVGAGRAPAGVASVAFFDTTRENSPGLDTARMNRLMALS